MAEIGLRPTIGGHPLQFELSLHGQQKVYIFQVNGKLAIEGPIAFYFHLLTIIIILSLSLIQAQNQEVHDMWTSEIRRLLEAQLVLMKGTTELLMLITPHLQATPRSSILP